MLDVELDPLVLSLSATRGRRCSVKPLLLPPDKGLHLLFPSPEAVWRGID